MGKREGGRGKGTARAGAPSETTNESDEEPDYPVAFP
jgi:hypothetical protein